MYGGRTVLYFSKYTFIIKPFVILLRKKQKQKQKQKTKNQKKISYSNYICSTLWMQFFNLVISAVKFRKQRK